MIVPKVISQARQRSAGWQSYDDLCQEALGFAWLSFISWQHHHPAQTIGHGLAWKFARWAISRVSRFNRLAGNDRGTDVLSPRARQLHRVTVNHVADPNQIIDRREGGAA